MTSHTPGPWTAIDSWDFRPEETRGIKPRTITVVSDDESLPTVAFVADETPPDCPIMDRIMADAHLIAAAPKLLLYCRWMNEAKLLTDVNSRIALSLLIDQIDGK